MGDGPRRTSGEAEWRIRLSFSQPLAEKSPWYRERSPDAANGFLRELERGLGLISASPALWPRYEVDSRRYLLQRYPFSIIYRFDNDRITVVAVAHQSRMPGYWRDR